MISKSTIKKLYYQMCYIRCAEEKLAQMYPEQEMRCPVHLYIGQEAVAVGICAHLTKNDFVLSTHRAHGHYLAKGGNTTSMFAEIYGRENGCAKGRGGSMHLIDLSVGFLGSTPIVGNSIPVATGVAFAQKLSKSKKTTVVFFGDAAVEEGVFSESLNFAVLKKLPIIYVCENNLYSVYTPLRQRQPKRVIAHIAKSYGAKIFTGDGNNVLEVYNLMKKALMGIKKINGPVFIELATYRHLEHCGPNFDNDLGYRTETEFRKWKKQDPIMRLKKYALKKQYLNHKDFEEIDYEINSKINQEIKTAKSSPFPTQEISIKDVYSI